MGEFQMCDYSLHSIKSRPAKIGDKLTTLNFGTGSEDSQPQKMRPSRSVFCQEQSYLFLASLSTSRPVYSVGLDTARDWMVNNKRPASPDWQWDVVAPLYLICINV